MNPLSGPDREAAAHVDTDPDIREIPTEHIDDRADHPFFLATPYQPQLTSSREQPHPAFIGFVEAATTACLTN